MMEGGLPFASSGFAVLMLPRHAVTQTTANALTVLTVQLSRISPGLLVLFKFAVFVRIPATVDVSPSSGASGPTP